MIVVAASVVALFWAGGWWRDRPTPLTERDRRRQQGLEMMRETLPELRRREAKAPSYRTAYDLAGALWGIRQSQQLLETRGLDVGEKVDAAEVRSWARVAERRANTASEREAARAFRR